MPLNGKPSNTIYNVSIITVLYTAAAAESCLLWVREVIHGLVSVSKLPSSNTCRKFTKTASSQPILACIWFWFCLLYLLELGAVHETCSPEFFHALKLNSYLHGNKANYDITTKSCKCHTEKALLALLMHYVAQTMGLLSGASFHHVHVTIYSTFV